VNGVQDRLSAEAREVINPASALLQAHHVDPIRLRSELDLMP
jgi:hypothetical protein